jgi:hypothetical protein
MISKKPNNSFKLYHVIFLFFVVLFTFFNSCSTNEFDEPKTDKYEFETHEIEKGKVVTLISEPNEGWKFDYWEMDGENVSENEEFTFIMPGKDVVIIARFIKK